MKGRIKGGVHPLKTRGEGKLSTRDEAIREYIAESWVLPPSRVFRWETG